jgi:uncharacterized protein YbjT (DUF2867 family)
MKIVVIGGTGLIGSKVVDILGSKGHEVTAAAPNTGVNTLTGEGLAEALNGAGIVIDVSNSPSFDDRTAMDFFTASARNIAAAETVSGTKHHLALSVVGTDRLQGSGYFRAKKTQEDQIKASGIPYTILHATQFFEFIRGIAQSATQGDKVFLPDVLFQPMAAKDVAGFLAEAALGAPRNATLEVAGPEKFRMDQLTARVLAFDRDPRQVIADPVAPYYGLKIDDESLLPGPNALLGATHFDWWLLNVPPPPKAPVSPIQDRTPIRL